MAEVYREDIPQFMTAAVLEKFKEPLQIKKLPIPELKNGEVLVKLDYSGLCHSDLHIIEGDWSVLPPLPLVPGHEGVGRVVKIAGENSNDVKLGDKVCTPWLYSSCKTCTYCLAENQTLCESQMMTGFMINGSFSDYIVADADYVGKVPDTLSSVLAAPISCAGITAHKALKVLNAPTGSWVAIYGAGGGLGHLAVQYGKVRGLKIIGIDFGKDDFMRSVGCDAVVDSSKGDVIAQVHKIVPGGPAGVICFVPDPKTMKTAGSFAGRQATVVIVGIPGKPVEFEPLDLIMKQLVIKASMVGTPVDLREALEIAATGKVKSEVKVESFKDVNKHVEALHTGKIRGRIVLEI